MIEGLVDLVGFEPTTSSMPWKRAPNCATGPLGKSGVQCRRLIFPHGLPIVKPGSANFTNLWKISILKRW